MSQTWVIANLDKKEFINPHHLGDGAKLREFVVREYGPTNIAIALLLAKPHSLTGEERKLLGERAGSWYGNRIGLVGLYDDPIPGREETLYDVITGIGSEGYVNISVVVLEMVRTYLVACKPPNDP